jgi:hypothetical protein
MLLSWDMPIPVACDCGARLKVRDEAAGKTVKCPKCQSPIRVPEPEPAAEPELRIIDEPPSPDEAPAPKAKPGRARAAGTLPSRKPWDRPGLRSQRIVAWEVYVVMGLIVLGLLGSLKELAGGKGGIPGLGINVLMLVGLFKRTNWAWWLTTLLSGAGLVVCLLLSGSLPPELADAGNLLHIAAFVYGGIIGLLVLCRVRGAYLQ